jgi:hypothetical protein
MKYTLTLVLLGCLSICYAQIQFTRNDFGANGDKVIYAVDTPSSTGFNFGAAGANKTWHFNTRNIYPRRYDSTTFIAVSGYPNLPNITANLMTRTIGTGDQYMEVTDSFVKTIFDFPQANVNGVKLKTLPFPLTYQTQFTDSTTAVAKGTFADFDLDPLPPFDSVRINANVKLTGVCDGWGTLILPDSSSYQALKLNQQVTIEADVYFHSIIGWTYVTHRSQQVGTYSWYAPDSKNYLASVQLDTSGNITNFIYKIKKSPPYKKPSRLLSISPDTIVQGDTVDILVKGLNTTFTSGEIAVSSWDLDLLATNIINDSTLIVTVTTSFSSSTGTSYFGIHTQADGYMYLNNALTVIASPFSPKLIGIGPNYGAVGTLTTVTVKGFRTHFTKGTNAQFYSDSISDGSIYIQSHHILNDTTFTCDILIEPNAGYVPFSLYVNNVVDGSMHLTGAFIVTHTGLNEELERSVNIYPNPATEVLNISFNEPVSATARLFDLSGKEVKKEIISGSDATIRTADLDKGFYILKLTGENLNIVRKVLIQP